MKPTSEVLLVNMPFGNLLMPSIGLGLLKAATERIGISARIAYFTIRFAELVGPAIYLKVSAGEPAIPDLVGEWLFSRALFGDSSRTDEGYVQDIIQGRARGHAKTGNAAANTQEGFIDEILAAREKVVPFLDECLEYVIECGSPVIGFTSSFQQQVASLSLAARIKARRPDVFIVFGGANCEGAMGKELVRQFGFVDAVVSGEGEFVFPELVKRVLSREPAPAMPGLFTRANSGLRPVDEPVPNAPTVSDMDSLPYPDYDEYFEQLDGSTLDRSLGPRLLFETSRGCWWGEKHHCTFCGLNGQTMLHRSKTAERALNELAFISSRFPGHPVSVVDNILDMRYFKDFIPMLADRRLGVELFYEVKSNLKKDQVRLLHRAGVTSIQPGIESLSDSVLQLMKKGVSALQNIQLLKWCEEIEMVPEWNLLWGFPGEPEEEYYRMAKLIPLITHLTPPRFATTVRLDRFSPNYKESHQLGLRDVSPYPAYGYVYPFEPEVLGNLAYFFTFDYGEPRDVENYVKPLEAEIARWQQSHSNSKLFVIDKEEFALICDFRPSAVQTLIVLTGHQRFFYVGCDEIRTPQQLLESWNEQHYEVTDLQRVKDSLEDFVARGIMIRRGESYLALAVRRSLTAEAAS